MRCSSYNFDHEQTIRCARSFTPEEGSLGFQGNAFLAYNSMPGYIHPWSSFETVNPKNWNWQNCCHLGNVSLAQSTFAAEIVTLDFFFFIYAWSVRIMFFSLPHINFSMSSCTEYNWVVKLKRQFWRYSCSVSDQKIDLYSDACMRQKHQQLSVGILTAIFPFSPWKSLNFQ